MFCAIDTLGHHMIFDVPHSDRLTANSNDQLHYRLILNHNGFTRRWILDYHLLVRQRLLSPVTIAKDPDCISQQYRAGRSRLSTRESGHISLYR